MPKVEGLIAEALKATGDLRQELVDNAVLSYFDSLPGDICPDEGGFAAAGRKAESVIRTGLLSPPYLAAIVGGDETADGHPKVLALAFDDSMVPPLRIPAPSKCWQLKASGVAVTASLGAIVGMLVFAPLLRLAVGLENAVGMFLGAPLGAFGMVWLVRIASQRPRLRKALQYLMMAGAAADITIGVLRGKGFWGVVKRIFAYAATILVLRHITPEPKYDRATHEKSVELALEQWLNGATVLLACLSPGCLSEAKMKADPEEVIQKLGTHLYALHRSSSDQLPIAVSELLQEARNIGFDGLESEPLFESPSAQLPESSNAAESESTPVWTAEMRDKYNTHGHIEEGDSVIIERHPVVLNGIVLKRGVVRKLWRKKP